MWLIAIGWDNAEPSVFKQAKLKKSTTEKTSEAN